MGKRGPKPKPTALNLLDGNPSNRPLNTNEPQCGHAPILPNTVGADALASAEWHRLRDVCPPQLFTAMDTAALAQYCLAWSMLLKSQQALDTHGVVIEKPVFNRQGDVIGTELDVNPAARTWKAASETLLKCCDRLGLAPTARARIQLPTRSETQSKFAGLLGKQASI